MSYGIIEYNEEGLPMCEICGEYHNRVMSHVRQKHQMDQREYKKMFGFDLKKGICSRQSSAKTRVKTLSNYDKCIQRNLVVKGQQTRFKIGDKGRTKDKVSEQTRIMLRSRLKNPKMVAAMKVNGKKLGESGLGNKARWSN